ncbi:MAG: Duplicated orphan permease [Verrucomicrobia bacterium]|nr:Duplicated orphan permease [Verrucomicrobiota bacterium]
MHLRLALRQLAKAPGYTALAVGALALGIGANTVLFSAINTLFLRPLPYPEPERLVRVWGSFPERGLERANLSWPRFRALRDEQQAFSRLAAHTFSGFTFTGKGEPEQLQAMRVTANFFPTIGVQPLLGRTFTEAEDRPGGANAILLSHGFWQRRFGGASDIIGRTLVLNGSPHTVIGILPASLGFPWAQVQVWAPRVFEAEGLPADLIERGTGFLLVIGRLQPGVSIAQAEEQLRVISRHYGAAFPDKVDSKAGLTAPSFHEDLVGGQRPMFLTLLAAVGCVLLVACANVANLMLARFAARRKEIAIRTALGATRRRIVGQFLTESVLTAAIAGALGVLLAFWGLDVLARVGENFIPRASEVSLDGRVLGFAVALSLLTGIVLGLVPALQASRTDAIESLKDSSRGSTGGRHTGRMRGGLLVAEVALSLVLLVVAALLMDSFRHLQRIDPGFRSDNIATFNLALPAGSYPDIGRQARLFEQVLEKIRALPGVTAAATTASLPAVGDGFSRSPAAVEGRPLPPVNERSINLRSTISPGFFPALGIPLRQGRDFTWRDRDGAPNVVIVNEFYARKIFPGENPVGRKLITGIASIPREIVGVVGDVRSEGLAQTPQNEMYYPSMQVDGAFQTVVVRSSRPAASLRAELIAAVHAVDPGLPVAEVQPYAELLAQGVADRRFATTLLGAFAGLALVLAGMGIYSVIAYGVAQRTQEFGIRLALGAAPGDVVRLVMSEGLKLAALGLALGLLAALALTRLMQAQLFEVSANDPAVIGGVALFLCSVCALACYVPARRATKVDPMTALRAE